MTMASCATFQPQEVKMPPEKLSQKGYSLVPLNEKGWLIVERSAYDVTLLKQGVTPDEVFAIQAMPYKLPVFKTREEFARLIKEDLGKSIEQKGSKILKHEVFDYLISETDCIKSYKTIEDLTPIDITGKPIKSGDIIFEVLSLFCVHPKDKNKGFTIIYSHQHHLGESDILFAEKA